MVSIFLGQVLNDILRCSFNFIDTMIYYDSAPNSLGKDACTRQAHTFSMSRHECSELLRSSKVCVTPVLLIAWNSRSIQRTIWEIFLILKFLRLYWKPRCLCRKYILDLVWSTPRSAEASLYMPYSLLSHIFSNRQKMSIFGPLPDCVASLTPNLAVKTFLTQVYTWSHGFTDPYVAFAPMSNLITFESNGFIDIFYNKFI